MSAKLQGCRGLESGLGFLEFKLQKLQYMHALDVNDRLFKMLK